jgi:hypothetical protein
MSLPLSLDRRLYRSAIRARDRGRAVFRAWPEATVREMGCLMGMGTDPDLLMRFLGWAMA